MDVQSIERATLAAVAPETVLEIEGWLVGLDPGTIRRAGSAVPLDHRQPAERRVFDRIEAAYAERDLRPAFRVADMSGLAAARDELARRGFAPEQPTLVKVGSASAMMAAMLGEPAEVVERPDDGWADVFTGEGFDPIDGANRVRNLTRSADALYGQVREDDRTVAVGVVAFGEGWASIHGMRTALDRRGRGMAGRVLSALGHAAMSRGIDRVFLQVEEANEAARSLYRRLGFETAWRYWYWARG